MDEDFKAEEKKVFEDHRLNNTQIRLFANLKAAVSKIWQGDRNVKSYTDHGIPHCEDIFVYLGRLLPLAHKKLEPKEAFVLFAAVYLHDIGMQNNDQEIFNSLNLDIKNTTQGKYNIREQKIIRENHHRISAAWIKKAIKGKCLDLSPIVKEFGATLPGAIVEVVLYHAKEDYLKCESRYRLDPDIRLKLLVMLLRLADELDIGSNRIDIEEVRRQNLDLEENGHIWWLHYLTNPCIDVTKGNGIIKLITYAHSEDLESVKEPLRYLIVQTFEEKNKTLVDALFKEGLPLAYSPQNPVSAEVRKIPVEVKEALLKKYRELMTSKDHEKHSEGVISEKIEDVEKLPEKLMAEPLGMSEESANKIEPCYIISTGETLIVSSTPLNFMLPSGFKYLGNQQGTSVHYLYREKDSHIVCLFPACEEISMPFLIDKFEITTQQYCNFLKALENKEMIHLKYDPKTHAKYASDSDGNPLIYDCVDQEGILMERGIITNQNWGVIYGDNRWCPIAGCENLPVIFVTWLGALMYSLWVNGKDLSHVRDDTAYSYLPNEKQWEMAATWNFYKNKNQKFPWGDTWDWQKLNGISYWAQEDVQCKSDWERLKDTKPDVFHKARPVPVNWFEQDGGSPCGCLNMLGNVWEWCYDADEDCLLKGGCCISPNEYCQPEYGVFWKPERANEYTGFRCCRPLHIK